MDGMAKRMQTGCMFTDRYYTSPDGLRLHCRDYAGTGTPIVCLHGLARNARDFEGVAAWLAGRGHRVLVPDMRGRGASAWADPKSYALPVYLGDLDAVFADAGIEAAVFVGTSMGGLLTMLTAAARPGRVLAACLNDIGPVVERAGLERIADYIGKTEPMAGWDVAAEAIARGEAAFFPAYDAADWALHARRRCRELADGRVAFDYDPAIAATFSADPGDGAARLWPMLDALAGVPVLSVRGALSDLFTAETQSAMAARLPRMEAVALTDAGHAPTLEEPESMAGLARLVAGIAS